MEKTIGDIYIRIQDYNTAFRLFKRLKKNCEFEKKYKEKIYCYERIGLIHRMLRHHNDAIICFKKMMCLSWCEKDLLNEGKAYDLLSIDYFYLGQLDKAEYYHDRFIRGKTENNLSIAKSVAIN